MRDELRIELNAPESLQITTRDVEPLTLTLGNAVAGTSDYTRLRNKPVINGVEVVGSLTSEDLYIVNANSTAGWASNPEYIPKQGEIIVYTDYAVGPNNVNIPGIKIGDGLAYVVDLPFVSDDIRNNLLAHTSNTSIHITDAERTLWNSKVNVLVNDNNEELLFFRN